jgi:predicted dehydrogenase
MTPLRVGVVGSGFGGAVHVPAFRAQGRFEVVAIASPSRAADVARERKVPHAFASAHEMLDAVDLDVVSVASPPFDHLASVLAALDRGTNSATRPRAWRRRNWSSTAISARCARSNRPRCSRSC